MNPVIKAQLNEFKEKNLYSARPEYELFELYSIFCIMNGVLGENIDPYDLHLRGDEFGLDGAGILFQGETCTDTDAVTDALDSGKKSGVDFVFFQSKTSAGVKYGDVAKFFDAVYDFFATDDPVESGQLNDLMAARQTVYSTALKSNPNLHCYYATTGSGDIGDDIQKILDANKKRFADLNLFEDIVIHFVGAKTLQEAYRTAFNSISKTIEFSKALTLPNHNAVDEAYMGYLPASELIQLISNQIEGDSDIELNRSIFFDNIRDFDVNSDINKSIIKELKSGDRNSFVFKNNGITIVAKEVNRTGDRFRLDDYQIVNGCQTSNIIFRCKEELDNVFVPVRIIGSKDSEFVSSIIIGTNKQNAVKDEQFWALKPFMKDLEEYCRNQEPDQRIFLERQDFQYRQQQVERTRVIKPREVMKSVAAMFLFQPNRAARDYRGILSEFKDEVFLDNHNVQPYHSAALANYRYEFLIRNQRVDNSWRIYKFYSLFALSLRFFDLQRVLAMPSKRQNEICSDLNNFVLDEDKFVTHATAVAEIIEKMISESSAHTREQIRDSLRSETFGTKFADEFRKKIVRPVETS